MTEPVTIAARLRPVAAKTALACLFFLGLWLGAGASASAAEVINYFDSDVSVAKDGELTVVETIRVQAEGRAMRHGIYRDFPLTFRDAGGTVREVTFSILGITREGRPERYHTERRNNFIRIYIGSKDTLIPRGDHTYVFRYLTGRQVRWFDGKPELNWNVTGNYWNFPILTATYHLHLTGGAAPLRWTAFTGRLGARGIDWQGSIGALGTLSVATTRRLAPGEGLTVVAALPASAVEPPNASTLLWYQLFDNRHWIFGGVGFLVVLIYYFAVWEAVGRDPKRGTVIPLFHPPQGISPALANYIHKWGFGREKWRAFTAASLSLAVRGLIHFDNSGGKLLLKSTGKNSSSDTLPPGERAIFDKVSAAGTVIIDSAHGTTVSAIGKQFTTAIETESKNRFFRRNLGYVVAGFALTAAVVAGVVMFGGLRDSDTSILAFMGFGGFIAGIFLVPVLQTLFSGAGFVAIFRSAISLIVIAIFFSIGTNFLHAFSPNGLGNALPALWSFVAGYPFSFVLIGAFATLNGLFIHLMRAPTALGRPIMDALDGFKLYLETAEKDRLNYQAPEITTERFEALLPYAVALDVEKPWSQAFESALRRAHPNDPNPMGYYNPTWHSGGGRWSTGSLSTAVASTVTDMSSAFASAVPVSSGSSGFSGGGGGGSGGGGGGGGGGGW
jgi:hypothetical protein